MIQEHRNGVPDQVRDHFILNCCFSHLQLFADFVVCLANFLYLSLNCMSLHLFPAQKLLFTFKILFFFTFKTLKSVLRNVFKDFIFCIYKLSLGQTML